MGAIRLLLALSVLIDHSASLWGVSLLGGELAVQAFYVISGFYMAMILQSRYQGRLPQFYRNRFLRIFPIYWVVLLLGLCASGALWWHSGGHRFGLLVAWGELGSSLDWPALLLLGVSVPFLVFQDVLLYLGMQADGALFFTSNFQAVQSPLHRFLPIAPSWSLSLELYFYLMCPWITRWRIRWIAGLAALSFAVKAVLSVRGLDFDPWTYRFFPTSLGYFLLGMLAWKVGNLEWRWTLPKWGRVAALWITIAAMVAWNHWGAIASCVFVLWLASTLPTFFRLSRNWRWDRWVGELSYPLYLSHWLVFAILASAPVTLRFVVALGCAALLQITVGKWTTRFRWE